MMNTKLYQLSSEVTFTVTALNAEESILKPYIKAQIDVMNDFYVKYDHAKKRIETVTRDRRSTKTGVATATTEAIKLLKEISFRVKADAPKRYKNYFPVNYSTVIKKGKSLLKAYEIISSEINLETTPSLLSFKEQIGKIYEALSNEVNQLTDAETDHQLLQQEIKELYEQWRTEYRRLKMLVKAALIGTEIKHKIFFNTKSVKRRKDQTEYQPILPTSVTHVTQ